MSDAKKKSKGMRTRIDIDESNRIAELVCAKFKARQKILDFAHLTDLAVKSHDAHLVDCRMAGSIAMTEADDACLKALIVSVLVEAEHAAEEAGDGD